MRDLFRITDPIPSQLCLPTKEQRSVEKIILYQRCQERQYACPFASWSFGQIKSQHFGCKLWNFGYKVSRTIFSSRIWNPQLLLMLISQSWSCNDNNNRWESWNEELLVIVSLLWAQRQQVWLGQLFHQPSFYFTVNPFLNPKHAFQSYTYVCVFFFFSPDHHYGQALLSSWFW